GSRLLGSTTVTQTAGSVAFSPNGELLATGGQSVCFWEVSTGKLRRYFQTNDFVRAIACSSDGTAAIAAEGGLMVVQVSTGTSLRLPIPPGVNLASVCFSPTARLLAAAGDQG